MDAFERSLCKISGGRVLDVATGRGSFIGLLSKKLRDYDSFVGVDASEKALITGRKDLSKSTGAAMDLDSVHMIRMNAERLAFQDESFDTVCIGVSLHHLDDIPRVLGEMKRLLKPGGRFIVSEMYRDGQTEAQLSIVQIHHWAAEIDTALGSTHNKTLTRQQVLDFVREVGLHDLALYDHANLKQDPMNNKAIEQSANVIDEVLRRAEGLPDFQIFKQRGEALAQRLHRVGLQTPSVLIIAGEK